MDGERRVEGEACVVLFPLLFLLCCVLPLDGIMSDDGTRRTRTRAKETEAGGAADVVETATRRNE